MKCLLLDVSAAMDMVATETGARQWEQSYAHTFHKQSRGVPQGSVLGPFRSTLSSTHF